MNLSSILNDVHPQQYVDKIDMYFDEITENAKAAFSVREKWQQAEASTIFCNLSLFLRTAIGALTDQICEENIFGCEWSFMDIFVTLTHAAKEGRLNIREVDGKKCAEFVTMDYLTTSLKESHHDGTAFTDEWKKLQAKLREQQRRDQRQPSLDTRR